MVLEILWAILVFVAAVGGSVVVIGIIRRIYVASYTAVYPNNDVVRGTAVACRVVVLLFVAVCGECGVAWVA